MSDKQYYFHESSVIDEPCDIGDGTKIWHFSHIMKGAKIGNNCSLGQNVNVGGSAVIGNNVKIQNNVSVYDGVTLEDHVFCGPSMVFTNDLNPRSKYPKNGNYSKTFVKEGASIGANATIICGNTIGKHAFIGSGAVVTKDVPDYGIVIGNPAKFYGWICECGTTLDFNTDTTECSSCQRKYKNDNDVISEIER
ncbi:acyltransferase [Patescibacteria group bacterium]